jgi:hypothetical protein
MPRKRKKKNKNILYYKNVPFKPVALRSYEALQIAGKWKIFNRYTRKTAKDLEFNTQREAIDALHRLKEMMRNINYTKLEGDIAEQQGKVAYEKQMKLNMLRKKKPKPKLPPVPKFNESKKSYEKRLKKGRGTSKKNPIILY